ncbi:MAG: hypothetical protein RR523_08170 [Cetobacterium sp.]|uniref:hypothetical protein n=1 Tax=Cetobacterium sp. TaxID=2071632 RepID=UPI002FC5C49C
MLYDENGKKIYIESNNENRMILYNKVKLLLSLEIIKIEEEIKKMIRDYFKVYEDKGEKGHLRVAYVVGSVWTSSSLQEIYNVLLKIYNNDKDIAYNKSKEIIGCLFRKVMIEDLDYVYLCKYFGAEKGYIYTR